MPRTTDNVFRLISFLVFSFFAQFIATSFFSFSESITFGGATLNLFSKLSLQFTKNFSIFQLFSHPFLHSNTILPWGLLNVFFTSLVLYFFGPDLERIWGSHNFLKFFLTGLFGSILLAFFVSLLPNHNYVYHGIGGGNAAILVAYAMFWPDRQILFMFFIPMRMKWFIVLLFFLLAFQGGPVAFIQYSGGALAGIIFLYYYARVGGQYSMYTGNSSSQQSLFRIKERWQNYFRQKRLKEKQEEINRRIEIKAEVDYLLEKISKEGIRSLSSKEKKFLDHASKEF